jgi:hypothetical protein
MTRVGSQRHSKQNERSGILSYTSPPHPSYKKPLPNRKEQKWEERNAEDLDNTAKTRV